MQPAELREHHPSLRPTAPGYAGLEDAVFCKLHVCLYTPNLNNLGAKSPIVSGLHLKYSRFLETRARDRARSALLSGDAVSLNYFLFSARWRTLFVTRKAAERKT